MNKLRTISQDNAFRLLCLLAAGIAGVLMLGFMVQLAGLLESGALRDIDGGVGDDRLYGGGQYCHADTAVAFGQFRAGGQWSLSIYD